MKKRISFLFSSTLFAFVLIAQAHSATLGINTLVCDRPTGLVGWGDDHIYFLVSVSKPDGSAYSYRIPSNGYFKMNSDSSNREIRNIPLWQEPVFPGQRMIITVTLMTDESAGLNKSLQAGNSIAHTVSSAMVTAGGIGFPLNLPISNSLDQGRLLHILESIATNIGHDDFPGQFIVEVWNNGNFIHTLFKPTLRSHGRNTAPYQGVFSLRGDESLYQVFMGVNPW